MSLARHERALRWGLLLTILLTGWTLDLARLGERSLWADEGKTAHLARKAEAQGAWATVREDYGHPLHTLLTIGVLEVGGSEMLLRFPSAMAALLALPLAYAIGARLMSRAAGLAGAFLLAISRYALGYAQEARTYALLEMLALLSLWCLLQALDAPRATRTRWWLAYWASSVLLVYTHMFAWLALAAETLFAACLLLGRSWRAWRSAGQGSARRLDANLVWWLGATAAVGLAYVPWLPSLRVFLQNLGPEGTAEDVPGLPSFRLSYGFFRDLVAQYGPSAYDGRLVPYVAAAGLGLARLAVRRRWAALGLVALWFGVPIAVLSVVPSQHFFDFRYMIFLLPMLLLVVAEGTAAAAALVLRALPTGKRGGALPAATLALAAVVFFPTNLPALRDYQRLEKEKWREVGEFVAGNLLLSDELYVAPLYWSHPLLYYQPELEPFLRGGSAEDLSQLERLAGRAKGLWVLRYGGTLGDPSGKLTEWLDGQGFERLIDAHACAAGIYVYYRRFGDRAAERHEEVLRQAAAFCPADPRFAPSGP